MRPDEIEPYPRPEKRDASGRSPQGVGHAIKSISSRSKSSTTRWRVPLNRRRRLPEPGRVYLAKLISFEADEDAAKARACCPFHEDPKRSSRIELRGENGGWRGDSCGQDRDQIAMFQQLESWTFCVAVRWLICWCPPPVSPTPQAAEHIRTCRALLGKGGPRNA